MDQNSHVWMRPHPATQPIGEVVSFPDQRRPARVEIAGWIIQVMGDALIVTCAGAETTSMRAGQPGASVPLGQTKVVVRRDPPPSSRATEVGLQARLKTSVLIRNRQGQ
jgi:hypothetical protein